MYTLEGSKRKVSIKKGETLIREYSGAFIDHLSDLADISNCLLDSTMACSVFDTVSIEINNRVQLSDLISFLDVFFAYNQEIHEICVRYFYRDPRLYELFDNLQEQKTSSPTFYLSEENPGFDRMEYLQVRLKNEQTKTRELEKRVKQRIQLLNETETKFNELEKEREREIELVLTERNNFCRRFKEMVLTSNNAPF